MRQREPVFVDSGAWIALVLTRDPLHERARIRIAFTFDHHFATAGFRLAG